MFQKQITYSYAALWGFGICFAATAGIIAGLIHAWIAAVLALSAIAFATYKKDAPISYAPLYVALPLLLWLGLSTGTSLAPEKSLLKAMHHGGLLLLFALWLCFRPAAPILPAKTLLPAFLTFGCVLLLLEWLSGGQALHFVNAGVFSSEPPQRSSYNRGVAAALLLLWPALACLWPQKKIYAGLLLLLATLVVFNSALLTAQICLLGGLLLWLILPRLPQFWQKTPLLLAALSLLALPLLIYLPAHYLSAVPPSGLARLEIWRIFITAITQQPLLGWGMATAPLLTPAQVGLAPSDFIYSQNGSLHAHHILLHLWAELGLLALLWLGLVLALLWHNLWKLPQNLQPFILIQALCWLAFCCLSFSPWQEWWLGLSAFCAVLSMRLYYESKQS